MDRIWQETFRRRMHDFALHRPPREGEVPVSVKVRVDSGCFHREHSPEAYAIIDKYLDEPARQGCEFEFMEHESGPEVLIYLAMATAGTTLLKSLIDLITAIIRARSDGIQRGDSPRSPLELIVRRVDSHDQVTEEATLRIGHAECVDSKSVEAAIHDALTRIQHSEGMLPRGTARRSTDTPETGTPERNSGDTTDLRPSGRHLTSGRATRKRRGKA